MLEATHEGLCLLDLDSRVSAVNSRLCEMLGFDAGELVGRQSFDVLGHSQSEPATHGRRDVALKRKDGTTVWALISATPLVDDSGEPGGVLATVTNVTERKVSEQRANAAAEQIERLTADAIYSVGLDRLVWSWNNGAEQLLGWSKEEAIGQQLPMVPSELIEAAVEDVRRIVATSETMTKETVRLAKDGRRIPVLGSWSPVRLEDGSIGVLCILKDIRTQKAAHYKLREQAKALALLRERERIAMDLHDGAIQSLYGVALSLGALRRHSGDDGKREAVLGEAIGQLTETIEGIRKYIYGLRTGTAEEADLEMALQAKVGEVAARTGIQPRLCIEGGPNGVGPDTAMHLLYIASEALSNVARHAQAENLTVELLPWGPGLEMVIADDGRGFEPAHANRRRGDGLRNMRERATLLGAKLSIHSAPGRGTTVKVQLP